MIERLAVAVAILAALAGLGLLVRLLASRRVDRLVDAIHVAATGAAGPRLLVFSTRFCADCVAQRRVIEEVRPTWPLPVDVTYHDAVADGDLARSFGILTVPALIVARADGRVIGVRQGLVDGDRLRSLIDAAA